MSAASAIRAGKAFIELYTKDSKLVKGLASAQKKLDAWGKSIVATGATLMGAGTAMMTPLLAAVGVFTQMGGDLDDIAQRTGASVEALSELGFAAKMSGTNLETVESAIKKMQKQISEAADGTKGAVEGLAKLGLTAADLINLSPDEQFKLIADRISQINNPALQTAAAMEIFGNAGAELKPLMADGAAGIEQLQQRARELGLTMSSEDAAAAAALGDQMDTLWDVLKQGVFTVGSALAPLLTDLATHAIQVAVAVSNWIKENKQLVVTAFKVAAAIVAAGAALVAIGGIVVGVGAVIGGIGTIITFIGTALGALASLFAFLVTPIGLVIAAVVALGGYLIYSTGAGAQAIEWLGQQFQWLKDLAGDVFGGIADAIAAGDLALAAKIAWKGLQIVWQAGIAGLMQQWLGWKHFFLNVWDQAVGLLAKLFIDGWAGLQVAWVTSIDGLLLAWDTFTGFITQTWHKTVGFIAKAWTKLQGMFTDIDVDATIAAINEDTAAKVQESERATASAVLGRVGEHTRKRAEIEANRVGAKGLIDEDNDRAARNRLQIEEERRKADDAELQRLKDELAGARAEAKQKRAEIADRPAPLRKAAGQLDGLDDVLTETKQQIDVKGTFNAAGAFGIGADTLAERTAAAAEKIAKNTAEIARNTNGTAKFSLKDS